MHKRHVGFLDKLEQSSACSINKNFKNSDRPQFTREIHENELTPTGLNSAYFDFFFYILSPEVRFKHFTIFLLGERCTCCTFVVVFENKRD